MYRLWSRRKYVSKIIFTPIITPPKYYSVENQKASNLGAGKLKNPKYGPAVIFIAIFG